MDHFTFLTVLQIFLGAIFAGSIGSLAGLGGGILIVPMLTLLFGLPIEYAAGASIIAVIATSSSGASSYIHKRLTNVRVGMFLEMATAAGAICGAFLTGILAPNVLFVIFGIVLLFSVVPLLFKLGEELPTGVKNDLLAARLGFATTYPDECLGQEIAYQVQHTAPGLALMYVAGVISGLLGVGSGVFKVLAMDSVMKLPLKISTTTSTFMIGVTAAASAGIYFARGDVQPMVAAPVALGVLLGALIGAHLLRRMSNKTLRLFFIPMMAVIALQMVLRGMGISI